jgi:hypothetical protein
LSISDQILAVDQVNLFDRPNFITVMVSGLPTDDMERPAHGEVKSLAKKLADQIQKLADPSRDIDDIVPSAKVTDVYAEFAKFEFETSPPFPFSLYRPEAHRVSSAKTMSVAPSNIVAGSNIAPNAEIAPAVDHTPRRHVRLTEPDADDAGALVTSKGIVLLVLYPPLSLLKVDNLNHLHHLPLYLLRSRDRPTNRLRFSHASKQTLLQVVPPPAAAVDPAPSQALSTLRKLPTNEALIPPPKTAFKTLANALRRAMPRRFKYLPSTFLPLTIVSVNHPSNIPTLLNDVSRYCLDILFVQEAHCRNNRIFLS